MVAPGQRCIGAHFEDVLDNTVESDVGAGPDVVEQGEDANVDACRLASTGSSPRRKYRAVVGEDLLSFRKPRKVLF